VKDTKVENSCAMLKFVTLSFCASVAAFESNDYDVRSDSKQYGGRKTGISRSSQSQQRKLHSAFKVSIFAAESQLHLRF
jgi:hypothetical protein